MQYLSNSDIGKYTSNMCYIFIQIHRDNIFRQIPVQWANSARPNKTRAPKIASIQGEYASARPQNREIIFAICVRLSGAGKQIAMTW